MKGMLLFSPLARWIFHAQYWLLIHGYFWLGLNLPRLLRWAALGVVPLLWLLAHAREVFLLWVFPARAGRLARQGQTEKAIRTLRRSVDSWTPLLGTRPHFNLRLYKLAQMLENARRHGEACDAWERLANRPALPAGFEADIRKRWANNLENTGDFDGAARQRALADDRLGQTEAKGGGDDWSVLFERGKAAKEAHRYDEALALLERALAAPKPGALPAKVKEVNVEIASRVALSAHSAGRNERAESAARWVVEQAHSPFWRGMGAQTLALALGTLNRLPEALGASEVAIASLTEAGQEGPLNEARAHNALLLEQSGQVTAALAQCEAVAAAGSQTSRTALHVASNCHLLLGDYAAAREMLERARRVPPFITPAAERHMQGLLDMEGAHIETSATRRANEDRASAAWDLLQRAKPGIAGFERIECWHFAAEAVVLAQLGQTDAARARVPDIEAKLAAHPDDVATVRALWSQLALLHAALGEHADAAKWWRMYVESPTVRPVYRAEGWYECGVSLQALGDEAGARRCFGEVVALGFDIAATSRARAALGGDTPASTSEK